MALPTGSQAPDFTLKTITADGPADYTLSSNFGKNPVVLLFFPLAFTGVCTQEMCDVTAGMEKYNSLNAEVLAVSVDSPFAQQAWAEKEGIKVKLLSDLNKKTAHAYGVLLDDLLGFGSTAARAAFVIDKAGLVVHSEQTATPKDLPDFNKIAEALSNL